MSTASAGIVREQRGTRGNVKRAPFSGESSSDRYQCLLSGSCHYRPPKYCILYNWIEYRESATWCLLTLGNGLVKSKIVLNHGLSPGGCKVKHDAVSRAGPQRMQVIKGRGETLTKTPHNFTGFFHASGQRSNMCWAAQFFQVVICTKPAKKKSPGRVWWSMLYCLPCSRKLKAVQCKLQLTVIKEGPEAMILN